MHYQCTFIKKESHCLIKNINSYWLYEIIDFMFTISLKASPPIQCKSMFLCIMIKTCQFGSNKCFGTTYFYIGCNGWQKSLDN